MADPTRMTILGPDFDDHNHLIVDPITSTATCCALVSNSIIVRRPSNDGSIWIDTEDAHAVCNQEFPIMVLTTIAEGLANIICEARDAKEPAR